MLKRILLVVGIVIGVAGVGAVSGAPAMAQGAPVAGSGTLYYLNDSFSGAANTVFSYGSPDDSIYFGDWDGNGTDTPMIQRNGIFYLRNSNTTGAADIVFAYGDPGDLVLVGDWNGDGIDTLAVRRGSTFYIKNSISTGTADAVITYGDPGDVVLVGDWDGNNSDTFAVRRSSTFFVKNSITTGVADYTFLYGDPGDTILIGDWDGNNSDTLAVRRGITYYLRNSTTSGVADVVFAYGNPSDTAFAGDWNGDNLDTLAIRRPVEPPVTFQPGTYVVGPQVAPGTYRSTSSAADCYWERLRGFSGSFADIISNDFGHPFSIVTIAVSDAGFSSNANCGSWVSAAATFPPSPAASFGDGTYVVNGHVQSGTYQSAGGPSCYWERLRGFSGTSEDIIANDFAGATIVTISPSDMGFSTNGCGVWSRIA